MKKILHIVEATGGGILSFLVDLTTELVEDYEIFIAYGVREQTPENIESYFDKRIKLIKIKDFTREINPKKDYLAQKHIRQIYNEVQPEIIHLHSSKAGVLGRLFLNSKKARLFYTPHGYSFLKKDDSSKKRFIYKTIEKITAVRDCKTIACGKGEYEVARSLTINASYVSNGVNIKALQNILEKIPIKAHSFTIFTLGRISYQKNPELFNQIAENFPDYKFIWVGDGEMRNKLTSSNILVTGWVSREEALSYGVSADVFILTSLWEGLPISLLEAMFLKKICVVSDVIGNNDIIQHNVNGFVCDQLEEFIQAINTIDKNYNMRLINNAYHDIESKYNTKRMAEEYNKIYSMTNEK